MKTLIVLWALLQAGLCFGQSTAVPASAAVDAATVSPIAALMTGVPTATPGANCVEIPIPAITANIADMLGGNKVAGLLGLLLILCRTLSEILGQGGGLLEKRYPALAGLAYPLKMLAWLIGKFGFGTPTHGTTMPAMPKEPPIDPPKAA